jgi:UDPglucose--hexose-1-phosphate uridylyltransferase
MTELRREPISRRWVVTTPDEPKGPEDYLPFKPPYQPQEVAEPCPFCPGNEAMTPRETLLLPRPGSGWSVRVVPNKFPFFRIEGDFERRAEGMYDIMEGIGAHEIIVETPEHDQPFAALDPLQIERILFAYRERIVDLARDRRFEQILILKNYPGVFNRHPHSHIMAMPVIPKGIDEEIFGTLDYFQRKERCIFCDIIKEEIGFQKRAVLETTDFLVFCPFASRYPFEVWIIPKIHSPDFHSISGEKITDLSVAMKGLFRGLCDLLSDPPYSLTLHSSPVQPRFHRPEYHWHIEIRLRIGLREGFEWGTGFFVNPTPPEYAALHLKRAIGT